MGRFVVTLLAFLALAGGASAAEPTVVGQGTTAWGQPFTLTVTTQESRGAETMRCLNYEDANGGGGGCPLTRPALDAIDAETSVDCDRKRVALYGAIDAGVARVLVRLVGGRLIEATRFEPVPAIDPQMAYWAATFKGTTLIRSVTTVAADGSVLTRDRNVAADCSLEPELRGRRYPIGTVTDRDGTAWRLDALRSLVRDDGRLVRTLCVNITEVPSGDSLTIAGSATCGFELRREVKALFVAGDALGCRPGINQIVYGLARRKVARIVIRGTAGVTVAVPKPAPAALHAGGRLWFAGIHVPRKGVVIDAQDRYGRTIAKDRVKQFRVPGSPPCPQGSFFGEI